MSIQIVLNDGVVTLKYVQCVLFCCGPEQWSTQQKSEVDLIQPLARAIWRKKKRELETNCENYQGGKRCTKIT